MAGKQETILESPDVGLCDDVIKQLESKFKKGKFLLARKGQNYLILLENSKGGPHPDDVISYTDGFLDGLEFGGDDDGGDGGTSEEEEVEVIDRSGNTVSSFNRGRRR